MKELTVYLDPNSEKKLYEQIYEYIVSEIRAGKLLDGERLPSTRSLADMLGISRSTATFAYDQLEAEGYIEARPYKGYFVCKIEDILKIESQEDCEDQEKEEEPERQYQIDVSQNAIDMSLFPFDTWRRITRNTLMDDRLELFSPGEAQGDMNLRRTISRYLHAARGVNCEPERIIIGAGNDYLLMLLRYILGEKRVVAMENPTYQRAYRIMESLGYEMRTVPMDAQGLSVKALYESDADTVYVMPSHQYPTGKVMPIGRRTALLSWASKGQDRYLIEDDYDSEFRYQGKPIPALQTADRNGRVIYIGTFSKAIAPAIRISYMVLPEKLMRRYHEKCSFLSSTVSRVDQATLNEFIQDGFFERHLNKMRKYYRQKHDLVLSTLRKMESSFAVSGENAGTYLLLTSKQGLCGATVAERASAMNLKVYPLEEYLRPEDADMDDTWIKSTVLLGFGGLSMGQLRAGLKLLQICLR